MMESDSYRAATTVIAGLQKAGHVALLAGGCVRDHLLGLDPKDHDVATDATPDQVCRIFRRTKKVGAQFGVVIVKADGVEIEVATFRTDGAYGDGRRPDSVEFGTDKMDASRRDFTINGMFYDPVEQKVVDYVGGQEDLAARVVRCIGTAADRFAEDHLRMLRAVRFAARLGFEIEESTFEAIRRHADKLPIISPERIRMELEMILCERSRGRGWRLIADSGLAGHLAPSLSWVSDQVDLVERILANLPEEVSIPLGLCPLLCHLSGKKVARVCVDLRCSNEVTSAIAFLVGRTDEAARGRELELANVKELMWSAWFGDLCRFTEARLRATGQDTGGLEALRRRASEIPEALVHPEPFVRGEDLAALGLHPGPLFGRALSAIYRRQLNEELTDAEAAQVALREFVERASAGE